MSSNKLTIPKPDDWHVHLREEAMLQAVLPYTTRQFARAVVMPNLKKPIMTAMEAREYRKAIRVALPPEVDFTPLMTAYLTDTTDPEDLVSGHKDGTLFAAKYYPANTTTHSQKGVTDIQAVANVLERMQKIGMPLLLHGEVNDISVDIFDTEEVFVDRILVPLRRHFPGLKIVLEHITTKYQVDYVLAEGQDGMVGATITAHHLLLNRNALFSANGLRPLNYCRPILKREGDRKAIIEAATSGGRMFFLGTDSAPHSKAAKESANPPGGIFTAMNAIELYAQVFDEAGALDRLAAFASLNGPAFHGLPINKTRLELEKLSQPAPALKPILTSEGAVIVPFQNETPLLWRAAA